MDRSKYRSALINLASRLKTANIVVYSLLLANIVLAMAILDIDKNEKTIIVPVTADQPFTVEGKNVSSAYYAQVAEYLAPLLLHYHPRNARTRFDIFLKYVDSRYYPQMKATLERDAEKIERSEMSSVFHLMKVEAKQSNVILSGEQTVKVGNAIVSQGIRSYAIGMEFDGSLKIKSFGEVVLDKDSGKYVTMKPEADE